MLANTESTAKLHDRRVSRDEDTAVATMLHACVRAGSPARALQSFDALVSQGYRPSASAPYCVLLEAAAAFEDGDNKEFVMSKRCTRVHAIFEGALAAGVIADSRLVAAFVSALVKVGKPGAASAALERGRVLGAQFDVQLLRASLQACVASRSIDLVHNVATLQARHSVALKDVSDLWLRAHIGIVPSTKYATNSSTLLDGALDVYEDCRRERWSYSSAARRSLLRLCAHHGRVSEAIELLGHMQEEGVEPGIRTLTEVMKACRRTGDIDEATLQLWLRSDTDGP